MQDITSVIPLYLWFIIVYVIIYTLFYALPYMSQIFAFRLGKDLEALIRGLRLEVTKATYRDVPDEASDEVSDDVSPATDTPEEEDVKRDEEDEKEGESKQSSQKKKRSPGQEQSTALQADFSSTLVQQAANQLHVKYPEGDFRTFNIEVLPGFSVYQERLSAARRMSGLFVLVGLLGTMFKLETIVGQIGVAAGSGSMDPDSFLSQMSAIMGNTSGAFMSSIAGLALMVIVLVVIGVLDRFVQWRFDKVERVFQGEVVPALAQLQKLRTPNLSMRDLIEETGALFTRLNGTINQLTSDMDQNLAGLGNRIEEMLEEFGSFQKQYAELDSLLKTLSESSESMTELTRTMRGAARSLHDPIGDFNEDVNASIQHLDRKLNETVREHMAIVGDAIQRSESESEEIAGRFNKIQRTLDQHLQQVEHLVEKHFEQVNQAQGEVAQDVREQMDLIKEQSRNVAQRMKVATRMMEANAQAMKAPSPGELSRLIRRLDEPDTLFSWVRKGFARHIRPIIKRNGSS